MVSDYFLFGSQNNKFHMIFLTTYHKVHIWSKADLQYYVDPKNRLGLKRRKWILPKLIIKK